LKITIWSRKQKESKNDLFRLACSYRGVTIKEVEDFFNAPPLDKVKMIKEFKLVDYVYTDQNKSWVRYMRTGAPMISDRETVTRVEVVKLPNGNSLYIMKSCEDDRYPETKKAIRMYTHEFYEFWETEEDG